MTEKCANHPEKDAVGHCLTCGRPFCRSCVIEMPDGRLFCRLDASLGMCYRKQGANRLSTLAFVLALVGCSNPVTGIAGVIIGMKEQGKISRGEAPQEGKGLARAAVILGSLSIAFWLAYLVFEIVIVAFA